MTRRRALITGIGGQDGSYLAELLLEQGYEVYGFDRLPLAEHYDPDFARLPGAGSIAHFVKRG